MTTAHWDYASNVRHATCALMQNNARGVNSIKILHWKHTILCLSTIGRLLVLMNFKCGPLLHGESDKKSLIWMCSWIFNCLINEIQAVFITGSCECRNWSTTAHLLDERVNAAKVSNRDNLVWLSKRQFTQSLKRWSIQQTPSHMEALKVVLRIS